MREKKGLYIFLFLEPKKPGFCRYPLCPFSLYNSIPFFPISIFHLLEHAFLRLPFISSFSFSFSFSLYFFVFSEEQQQEHEEQEAILFEGNVVWLEVTFFSSQKSIPSFIYFGFNFKQISTIDELIHSKPKCRRTRLHSPHKFCFNYSNHQQKHKTPNRFSSWGCWFWSPLQDLQVRFQSFCVF